MLEIEPWSNPLLGITTFFAALVIVVAAERLMGKIASIVFQKNMRKKGK